MRQCHDHRGERSHEPVDGSLYRSVFERSGLGIARLDPRGRIVEANTDLLALLDRPLSQIRGRDFTDLLHPALRPALERGLACLATGERGRFAERVAAVRPDGSTAPAAMTAIAVPGRGRAVSALLVLLRRSAEPHGDAAAPLSDVHARILEGVAAGESTAQLATTLFLTRQGVEYHLGTLLRKLKAPNRTALISRAYSLGVLSPADWPPKVEPAFVK
ncbi:MULTISPECIES: LuxR C-terminal-related transcriptional regulator [Actinosynnema]|uniref:LuxR family transcriptional regulator n=1 Tax=Actinosynnema pretiosum TaxID=42197 RepID=A0A290Z9K7_9PSEU|nr:LuxR C-terminal-related transcriptional regulator [Actinosynnema pretiosum]ATE55720.1 LuxR family transcriptional regulator [Actinosynnema pretiosum]